MALDLADKGEEVVEAEAAVRAAGGIGPGVHDAAVGERRRPRRDRHVGRRPSHRARRRRPASRCGNDGRSIPRRKRMWRVIASPRDGRRRGGRAVRPRQVLGRRAARRSSRAARRSRCGKSKARSAPDVPTPIVARRQGRTFSPTTGKRRVPRPQDGRRAVDRCVCRGIKTSTMRRRCWRTRSCTASARTAWCSSST